MLGISGRLPSESVAGMGRNTQSFAQRRQQIVGDCVQLKTDADVYNDRRKPAEPIQTVLDFTLDVMELQQRLPKAA